AATSTQWRSPPWRTATHEHRAGSGRCRHLALAEPSLVDQRSDLRRVLDEITDITANVDPGVLATLPRTLREADFSVTAVIADDRLIAVEAGDTTDRVFGVAIDLGTTTVVATLMDLTTGTPAAVASALNRQQPFGADVISRISATMLDPDALARLRELAHQTMAELVADACAEAGVDAEHVYDAAIAGNATMTQIAMGIDPEPLGVAPFIPATVAFPTVLASEMGLAIHPRARAFLFPSLGAYVGGDIIAGALASGMDRDKRLRLFIDIGTNCEIILADGERLLATAAPAGPAFEAASISCGMRAAAGAIEAVAIADDGLRLQVIEDAEPVGICGSGLVDAVAELARVGLLDHSGRFIGDEQAAVIAPTLADRLVEVEGGRAFRLAEAADGAGIYLTQRDVRELQFAKAAISTGWKLLLQQAHVAERDVQQVLLAGSFGTYLSARNAIRIGLVPKIPALRVVSAGNVAGEGAKMALLSGPERNGATALIEAIDYIELSDRSDFNDLFVDELAFPGS
ncbi:MAG: ASKHA domain-containing protein, partial [Actinomycetales bacterium]